MHWFKRSTSIDLHAVLVIVMAIEEFLIPPWLLEHPEMQRRGIHLADTLWPGKVFATDQRDPMAKAVKILDPSTNEAEILEELMKDITCPARHIAPCEVVRAGDKLLGIMPLLHGTQRLVFRSSDTLALLLDLFDQLLEGIIYLHERKIAHMDLYSENVRCLLDVEPSDPRLRPKALYIIDFDRSRQLALPPGAQGAVALGGPATDPPKGVTHLDPYSWDVYCAGTWLYNQFQLHVGAGAGLFVVANALTTATCMVVSRKTKTACAPPLGELLCGMVDRRRTRVYGRVSLSSYGA